jgi:hypothetical protein
MCDQLAHQISDELVGQTLARQEEILAYYKVGAKYQFSQTPNGVTVDYQKWMQDEKEYTTYLMNSFRNYK